MENVVIYARYSSHGQTEQSIEGQLKVCYEYAKSHKYHVVQEYIDRALTGTNDRRPQFQQMIEDSKNGLFHYVLVYQLDRFARDRYDSAVYKRILKKNGVKVLSAKENISADASGILVESVLEGMAEYYSAELSQKVKRGITLSAQKCKCIGGHRLFGYDTDKEANYIINEEEAKLVKMIHQLYVSGMPVQQIMNYLNSNHINNAYGKPWTINPLHRILGNKRYTGCYIFDGKETPNGIPRIIDDDLYQKTINLKSKRKSKPSTNKAKVLYHLTGKVFCGECGRPMVGCSGTGRHGEKHWYYKCINRIKNEGCKQDIIKKDSLEKRIVDEVKILLTDEIIIDFARKIKNSLDNDNGQGMIKVYEKQLNQTKNLISRYTDLLIEDRNIDLIMDKIDSLRKELEEIEFKIAKEKSIRFEITEKEIIRILKNIRDFDVYDENSKKFFFDTFVYKVFVYSDKKISVLLTMKGGDETLEKRGSHKSLMAEEEGFEPPQVHRF